MVLSRRYLRYGISAEKDILTQESDNFYGLVVPAHLAADQSESLPTFLRSLAKPFFVDPMSFAFGLEGADLTNADGDELKRSYRKLSERYRWPRKFDFMSEQISADDFRQASAGFDRTLSDFVQSVLDLQLSLSKSDVDADYYEQLAREVGEELVISEKSVREVEFLVAPYFFFSGYDDPAYSLTLAAARQAVELSPGLHVLTVLAMSADFLARGDFERLVQDFGFLPGVIVWVDAFNDQLRGEGELIAFRKLIRLLSAKGEVLNLYGGRFSPLLQSDGLAGYSTGICYGESKMQLATSGGVIPPRYYASLPLAKLPQADTQRFLEKVDVICNCAVCQEVLSEIGGKTKGWQDRFVRRLFPPKGPGRNDADVRLKRHFLEISAREEDAFAPLDLARIIEELKLRADKLNSADPAFFKIRASFLPKWGRALRADL